MGDEAAEAAVRVASMSAFLAVVRLRSGGGSYPCLQTVLNIRVPSTRMHCGEQIGCMLGCGAGYEHDAVAHHSVCSNLRGVLHAVGDASHEASPTLLHDGLRPRVQRLQKA